MSAELRRLRQDAEESLAHADRPKFLLDAHAQTILALLDEVEMLRDEYRRARFHERHNYHNWQQAEAKVARVTDLLDTWERSHSHLGVDRHHWGPSSRSLRAALAPAPTEGANGRQIGSDERVGTKEDA